MPLSQGCSNSFSEVMRRWRRQSRRSSRYPRSAAPRTGHEAGWRQAAAGLSAGREYHGSRRGPPRQRRRKGNRVPDPETRIPPSGLWILSTQKVPGFSLITENIFSVELKCGKNVTLRERKKPKAFELQQSFPASPCGCFCNCTIISLPNMPRGSVGPPRARAKKGRHQSADPMYTDLV